MCLLIRGCPLYRVLELIGEKVIIDKWLNLIFTLIMVAYNFIEKLDECTDVKVEKWMK